jgi:uncharacterized protein (DUF2062 family)
MTPGSLALTIAVGAALGVFPVLGSTTLLCALAAFALRLNHPAIQLANYAVYPLQLLLIAPFYAAGVWLFDGKQFQGSVGEIIKLFKNDFWTSLIALWDITVYAVLIWVLISPLIIFPLYLALRPVIGKLLPPADFARSGSSGPDPLQFEDKRKSPPAGP